MLSTLPMTMISRGRGPRDLGKWSHSPCGRCDYVGPLHITIIEANDYRVDLVALLKSNRRTMKMSKR